jgi:enoyl-[acyl-carrier protein] reductase I
MTMTLSLAGKVALIVGVANEHSIATGCAEALGAAGATLVITYADEKARPYVEPVAKRLGAALVLPLNVETKDEMEAVFAAIAAKWGRLDCVVHSIAFCPRDDLHGRVTDCSAAGFGRAMDISVHSLIRMAHLAEPLMTEGGAILTMSYYGAEKVVDHYNVMGPVKAALESTVRVLAAELGPGRISVNAISPGPLQTRAGSGSGIDHFDSLIEAARTKSPLRALVSVADVGAMAAFLASEAGRNVSGGVIYVDAGMHVLA